MSRATHQQRRARWLNAARPGWLGMTRAEARSSAQVDRRRWGDHPYHELTADQVRQVSHGVVITMNGKAVSIPTRCYAWAALVQADTDDLDDSPIGGKVVEAGVDAADRDVSPPALLVDTIVAAPGAPASAGVTLAAA